MVDLVDMETKPASGRWDERALAHLRERALVPRGAEMAARRPLHEVIKATLAAAGRSAHTRRSYLTAIGQFLTWLDREQSDGLPEEWRPFAAAIQDGRRTAWDFGRTPAAVLWLVNASVLDRRTRTLARHLLSGQWRTRGDT